MKHGIYTCVILMAFLALSESVYAVVPVFTIASDTIRRVVIYFDQEETDVDSCYKTNNQEINVLDSLLEERINSRYITALNVVTFVSPDGLQCRIICPKKQFDERVLKATLSVC